MREGKIKGKSIVKQLEEQRTTINKLKSQGRVGDIFIKESKKLNDISDSNMKLLKNL